MYIIMKQNRLLSLAFAFAASLLTLSAQEVSDAQYNDAMATIEANATYQVWTSYSGKIYYLTDDGRLTSNSTESGSFIFRKIEGDNLFKSPGWQFDQCFTNPYVDNDGKGYMLNYGYLRTDAGNARPDWEGQVWYKSGSLYAVRATNAVADAWGANTYWTVTEDPWGYSTDPQADYSYTPNFCWRLTKIVDAPDNTDWSQKEVQRLTNLPHVYINTFTGRSITSKENYVYARLWYVDEDDQVTYYDSLQIRGRGNSTWSLAKKPYRLKFHEKVKWLGKGTANTKNWVLLANHADHSFIRNAITSLLGKKAGLKFNPNAKFVDLTLNDQYVGNYQISDKIDVRAHRVKIVEQDYPLTETSDITGGYLMEIDGFKDFTYGTTGFYTWNHNVPVRIHYPDEDEIDYSQYSYINNYMQNFEDVLYSENFRDPTLGYRPLVDSTSLAAWYLSTEISGNVDGLFSTYCYKEQGDDHLYWGPLWDYDIAYNNDNRTDRGGTNNTERQLMADVGYGGDNSGCRSWLQRMWDDPWFADLINRHFVELESDGLEDYLNEKIDSLVTLLDQSQQLNYERWNISTRNLRERILYSTYDEYITYIRQYINVHLPYLRGVFAERAGKEPYIPEPEPEPVVPDFIGDTLGIYTFTNLGAGTLIDVDATNDRIVANSFFEGSETQQWFITTMSNGSQFIVNRATGLALTDPTEGEPTATTLTGTQLAVAAPDSLDKRQQWILVEQAEGHYNLNNVFSNHTANLSGGSSADGTAVLSYTNDGKNATSNNRQWVITLVDRLPEEEPHPDAIQGPRADFALAYDPQAQRLHFGGDEPSQLTFPVTVYNQAGAVVLRFRACDGASMSALPRGIYIVSWKLDGRQRAVKFSK